MSLPVDCPELRPTLTKHAAWNGKTGPISTAAHRLVHYRVLNGFFGGRDEPAGGKRDLGGGVVVEGPVVTFRRATLSLCADF